MTRFQVRIAIGAICVALLGTAPITNATGTRLKDLTTLIGVRPTALIGYGLVVGLNKTGDRRQTIFSTQSLTNMLRQFGVVVSPDQVRIENNRGGDGDERAPPIFTVWRPNRRHRVVDW